MNQMYQHKNGIVFRKLEEDDLPSILLLKQESWWGTHRTPIVNSVDQSRWFKTIPDNSLYMTAMKDNELVGIAGYTNIDWLSRTLDISGSIVRESRVPDIIKSAFAAGVDFAFEMLNMHRLNAEVLESHVAAYSLETNFLGFQVEGVKRKAVYKCGRYYDSFVLGLLREDWEKQSRILSYNDTCNTQFSHHFALRSSERINRDIPKGIGSGQIGLHQE